MPANLTPQYQKAEEEYRRAESAQEQIQCLEKMLVLLPKHKHTEKMQADLKTRLKETRAELAAEKAAPKKGKSYRFPRQGAGQVVIIGGPNAGKSRLLAALSNAQPEVAPYPYTTREPLPGMMTWEDVAVQLIDTPPISDSLFEPYLPNLVRSADAVLLCFDGSSDDAPDHTATVVEQLTSRKTRLARESGFVDDQFSVVQVKTLLVVTRADDGGVHDRLAFFDEMAVLDCDRQLVEFDRADSTAELCNRVYRLLNVIRLYTRAPGKPADYSSPYTLPVGSTVEDLAAKVHHDLADSLKYAKVWGSGLHDGQSVGREHVLADRDMVELHGA